MQIYFYIVVTKKNALVFPIIILLRCYLFLLGWGWGWGLSFSHMLYSLTGLISHNKQLTETEQSLLVKGESVRRLVSFRYPIDQQETYPNHYRFQGFLKLDEQNTPIRISCLAPSLVLNLCFTLQNSPVPLFCLRYVHIKGHFLQCIGFHTSVGSFDRKCLIFLVINSSEHKTFNIFICNVLMQQYFDF